jgi:hypothetical protein
MFTLKANKVLANALFLAFASLMFIGCGSDNDDNKSSSPASSTYYTVSFYDSNLDLLHNRSEANGTNINLTAIDEGIWYKANEGAALESYTVNQSISFYKTANVVEIADQDGLNNIGTNLYGRFILTDNITLDDSGFDAQGWQSIGSYDTPFSGILNGNGYTISGLWMERTASNNAYDGLFGGIANGVIKNLGVETSGDGIKGYNYVGIIAGIITNSTITNSYTAGSVSGRNNVGGMVGFVYTDAKIARSVSFANVYGSWDGVGGIAGTIQGASEGSAEIIDSYTTGNVYGEASWVGGIAGNVQRWAVINNCYAEGNISGVSSVGGIAGRVYYMSNVTNNAALNGLITGTYAGSSYIGAIVGENASVNTNTIKNNFALDTITVSGASAVKEKRELQTQDTYSDDINGDGAGGLGWKFGSNDANPWQIATESYPKLYWE